MKKLKLRQGVKDVLVGILLFLIMSGVVILINFRIEQTKSVVDEPTTPQIVSKSTNN